MPCATDSLIPSRCMMSLVLGATMEGTTPTGLEGGSIRGEPLEAAIEDDAPSSASAASLSQSRGQGLSRPVAASTSCSIDGPTGDCGRPLEVDGLLPTGTSATMVSYGGSSTISTSSDWAEADCPTSSCAGLLQGCSQ
jgi:hypothetical protein